MKSRLFLTGAAQGFSARRTQRPSQPESRGERRPAEKGPFMDGHYFECLILNVELGKGTTSIC